MLLFLSFFLLEISQVDLQAQQRIDHFQVFDDTSGLVKGVVSMSQDNQGFLWFGTEGNNGVFRYDGIAFKQYTHDPQNENSLVAGNIYSIITDRNGHIWFASTGGGLSRFNPRRNVFTNYYHSAEDDNSLSDNSVYSMMEDSRGNIWISTPRSLDRYSPDDDLFIHYLPDPGVEKKLSSSWSYHFYESRDGMIWIATYGGGLNVYDPRTDEFTVYRHDPDNRESISDDVCGAVIEDLNGFIWVGGKSGLSRLDRGTGKFTRYSHNPSDPMSLPHNYVWDIAEGPDGSLWLGSFGGGLSKFDRQTGQVRRFIADKNNPGSFSSNLVFFVNHDRSGVLWAGTVDGGLNKYSELNEQFSHYSHIENDNNSFKGASLFSVYQSGDGIIWIGGQGHQYGLDRWDRSRGSVTNFAPGDGERGTLPPKEILSFLEDSSGNLLLGQWGGVVRLDRQDNTFERVFPPPEYSEVFSDKMVKKIAEDREGNLWLATSGGLFKLNRDRGIEEIFYEGTPFSSLLFDRSGNLWAGTSSDGLRLLDKDKGQWTEMIHDPDSPGSFSTGDVMNIHQDRRGRIWIGTLGGLNLWDSGEKSFTLFGRKSGFISDSIFSILEDGDGTLWMGTSAGLVKFNPDDLSVGNFTVSDGLQGNEFSIRSDSAAILDDGTFCFIGKNGLTIFDPGKIHINETAPQIVLTSFKKYNREVDLETSVNFLDQVDLTWEDRMITFEFSALDFTNPHQNRYAYMLEGFDRDWIPSGNEGSATYTNLEGGEYVFRVRASNNHDVWNEEGISLPLSIEPPWWKSRLFYAALVSVILIFIAIVVFYVMKLLYEINEHKNSDAALIKLQSFLTNIINSMPSALIGIDENSRITQWNAMAAHRTGIPSEEALTRELYDVLPWMEQDREAIAKSLHSRELKEIRKDSDKQDRGMIHENILIYPLVDNGVEGAVIRIDDITEQVRIQEMMLQSEKMLSVGGLAAGMAHEINNPLGGLLQTISVMKKRLSELDHPVNKKALEQIGLDKGKLNEYLNERKVLTMLSYISESGRRIADIVKNMLSFSRKGDGRRGPVDLKNLLESTIALAGTDYETMKKFDFKNILISREYDHDLPVIDGESSKLQQVFLNIFKNSSQAMQEANTVSPRIKVRMSYDRDNREVFIEIEDNGPGMSEEVRKRIFEPFFTTKAEGIGTGLGMSVAYFIIKDNHKGEMTVQSSPGKGVSFQIRLPAD